MSLGLLASTSIQSHHDDNSHVGLNTATIPVQRNNYYTINVTRTSGNPGLSVFWMPLTKA